MPPCIAVIHATRAAVAPIEEAFERLWPEAETIQLLDESLSRNLDQAGGLTAAMSDRIERLARFGEDGGADAILYSCSAFGTAIEAVQATMEIPVLKPNEAMLEEALEAGGKIRLAATFRPSIPSILKELREMAARRGREVEAEPCFVPGALDALLANDQEKHDALIAAALGAEAPCGTVLLGQVSMARALPAVAARVDTLVLSSPGSAVRRLRQVLALRSGHTPHSANQLELEIVS
ncbi:MAG: aspartate/glutamate racemase family protein [bacterium]